MLSLGLGYGLMVLRPNFSVLVSVLVLSFVVLLTMLQLEYMFRKGNWYRTYD